ncbi:hypothetical protein BJX66DRAFT_340143 [Aspergillus keveii]|uniref:Ankyrin repeat protein n=1 Tax=Aspergillus keveii TaxID=714993 RepID=A0ABR4FZ86_9EURO
MTQAAGPALVRALQRGHLELVELFLAHSAKVNMRDCWDRTPLWHSACHGSADTVQALFDAGAVIEGTVDSDGDASLFMLAVTKRVSRAARDLLHNISPDKDCVRTLQGTEEPLTPKVLRRVIEEQAAVAKVLAKHGAMENEPRCDGLLPSERFAFEHDLAAILQRSLDMDPENLDRYDQQLLDSLDTSGTYMVSCVVFC